jgi:hypothetical protein
VYFLNVPFLYVVIPEVLPIHSIPLLSLKITLFLSPSKSPSLLLKFRNVLPLYLEIPPQLEAIQMLPLLSSQRALAILPGTPFFSLKFSKIRPSNFDTPPPAVATHR